VGEWAVAAALTVVSSVAGTLLFTEALARSFASYDFATPILLQKLQPVFVILLAAVFLRERLNFRYLVLVPVALIGSYLISFGAEPVPLTLTGKTLVYILAVGAALAWGGGTILSKTLLRKLDFAEATALRFLLAVPISLVTALVLAPTYRLTTLGGGELVRFVVIAFTTGAGAVLLYYRGLARTEAKVATIAELTFPVVSIGIAVTSLNPYGAPQVLSLANTFGIVVLLCAVLAISFDRATRAS
jgi:drug/metabolite transporter (DMT)-like permease